MILQHDLKDVYLIFTLKIEFFGELETKVLSKFKLMKSYYTYALWKKSKVTPQKNLKNTLY